MSNDVTIKALPAQTVAVHRTSANYSEIFAAIPAGFGRVLTDLAEADVDPSGAPFVIFHEVPEGDSPGDLAMCVPIAAELEMEGETAIVQLMEGAAAAVIHKGPYDDMGDSYATVSAWIHERGHAIVGPTREIYLNSPAEVGASELLTEILFPIDAQLQPAAR